MPCTSTTKRRLRTFFPPTRVGGPHDGRTNDLRQAIYEHFSDGSEANGVVQRFVQKSDQTQQDILNFLRSL